MFYNGAGVNKDYLKSESWFNKAAEAGNIDAMNVLAKEYLTGLNFKKDDIKAFTWFKKSAEEGCVESYDYLAMCYEHGIGVKMNSSKAVEWYNKAVENDDEESMYRLAFLYEMGNGVPKDDKKAFDLYKKSAERGSAIAQLSLAYCYFEGTGTQKSSTQAIYWATKARDAGLENAGQVLENMKRLVELEDKLSIYDNSKGYPNANEFSGTTVIMMRKMNSVYYVPCKINGLKSDFVYDTGAGMISLSSSFAKQLVEMGRLSEKDIVGKANSVIADGSVSQVLVANIKDVEIGGLHLYDVKATIKDQLNAPLLLGQSAIEKLGKVTIDGYKLIIHRE